MSDDVKAALTPEEWAEVLANRRHFAVIVPAAASHLCTSFERYPADDDKGHAIAALALHGQPEGFTRADVALLRRMGEQTAQIIRENPEMYERIKDKAMDTPEMWANLADRIEALLPPETPDPRTDP